MRRINRDVSTPYDIEPGRRVVFYGIVGAFLAVAPSALLLVDVPNYLRPWVSVYLVLWACEWGNFFAGRWVDSLNERVALLRARLSLNDQLTDEEEKRPPGRVKWMPATIGYFERAVYSVLIALNPQSGATFIGLWVGLKMAGGWQLWSKGTTYGNALFFTGLLGNAMSVSFGVVAGLVIYSWFHP